MSDACLRCHAGQCMNCAKVATPAGPMCREHADELAADTPRGERR